MCSTCRKKFATLWLFKENIQKHLTVLDKMRFWLMAFSLVQMSPLYHSFNIQWKAKNKKNKKMFATRRRKNGATMTELKKRRKKLSQHFLFYKEIFFDRNFFALIVTAAKRMWQKILESVIAFCNELMLQQQLQLFSHFCFSFSWEVDKFWIVFFVFISVYPLHEDRKGTEERRLQHSFLWGKL